MAEYFYRKGQGFSRREPALSGRIEWVGTTRFCDMADCEKLAAWRIGYGSQVVSFCEKHTLATMRSRRVWARTP